MNHSGRIRARYSWRPDGRALIAATIVAALLFAVRFADYMLAARLGQAGWGILADLIAATISGFASSFLLTTASLTAQRFGVAAIGCTLCALLGGLTIYSQSELSVEPSLLARIGMAGLVKGLAWDIGFGARNERRSAPLWAFCSFAIVSEVLLPKSVGMTISVRDAIGSALFISIGLLSTLPARAFYNRFVRLP